jgi:hypothetical protein
VDAWRAHLERYLQAAGGLLGTQVVPLDLDLPAPRATGPFVPDVHPRRDPRSGPSHNFHYRPDEVYQNEDADLDERTLALMFKRLHEMDVPEMMASILLQTPGQPWDYYRDMARQLWDEARHAMMGEVWFAARGVDWAAYPNHVGWSLHMNLDRDALERHAILYAIEQGLMDGHTGKRYELEITQQAHDPLAAHFQDFDWADEVLHAQIGRHWLKPVLGDPRAILAYAERASQKPTPNLEAARATTPQEDWWPRLTQAVLGKPSSSDPARAAQRDDGLAYGTRSA